MRMRGISPTKHLYPEAEVPLFGTCIGAPLCTRLYRVAAVPLFGTYIGDPLVKSAD